MSEIDQIRKRVEQHAKRYPHLRDDGKSFIVRDRAALMSVVDDLQGRIDRARAWMDAEPGEPGYCPDLGTRLSEVYTELAGGDDSE